LTLFTLLQPLWEQEVLVPYLLDSVTVFTLIILFLFFGLFSYRLFTIRKRELHEKRRNNVERVLFSYLEDEKEISDVKRFLKTHPQHKASLVEICMELLKSVSGGIERKLKALLEIDLLQKHYLSLLRLSDIEEKINALFYFKECRNPDPDTVEEMYRLIDHDMTDLAIAASHALVDSKPFTMQYLALERICKREDISALTILEHILIFSETDQTDFDRRGRKILKLIQSPFVPFRNRLSLIRGMGFVGFMIQAPALFNLLKSHHNGKGQPNQRLISALVETLGHMEYTPAMPLLRELSDSANRKICISCAKAAGSIGNDEAVDMLDALIRHPDLDVRYEAMNQLLKIGEPVPAELQERGKSKMPQIERNTIKEIEERREYQYV
jgi:hypothetical protein